MHSAHLPSSTVLGKLAKQLLELVFPKSASFCTQLFSCYFVYTYVHYNLVYKHGSFNHSAVSSNLPLEQHQLFRFHTLRFALIPKSRYLYICLLHYNMFLFYVC